MRPTLFIALATLFCVAGVAPAGMRWRSAAVGEEVDVAVLPPTDATTTRPAALPTVVYLRGLATPRVGRATDESILDDLRHRGHLVVVVEYAGRPAAKSPSINADALKLRRDIAEKERSFLLDQPVDVDRLFVVAEGFTVRRDVAFARDRDRVLAMDVIHPVDPERPVPLLMEITCDNVNRMGSASLLYCHDTLVDGASTAGFAAAMVDHPVRPPYKGIDDPMPESLQRMSAAVAKARSLSGELGTTGRVGVIGFSRGGPFAAMLAVRREADAALIHGNRYDYLDLLPNDPMLARFEKAWGPRDANAARWAEHGAAHYLDPAGGSAPMFLNTSDAESPEYRHGLRRFAERLAAAGVEHVYREDADGRGHRVSTDPSTLAEIYDFFHRHLADG